MPPCRTKERGVALLQEAFDRKDFYLLAAIQPPTGV